MYQENLKRILPTFLMLNMLYGKVKQLCKGTHYVNQLSVFNNDSETQNLLKATIEK